MTIKMNAAGMIIGNGPFTAGNLTVTINTSRIQSSSKLFWCRGTNGTDVIGGSVRPNISNITANTSFTANNLGSGANNLFWGYLP